MTTAKRLGIAILWTSLSLVLAAEDPSSVTFRSDPKAGKVERREQEKRPAPTSEPPALFVEVPGPFTECAAAQLLRLELARRQVEVVLKDGLTGREAEQDRRSEQVVAGLKAGIAAGRYGCADGDAMVAEEIMELRQTVMEHPKLLRRALAQAPLTTYTAARASHLLNQVHGVLKDKRLDGLPSPCDAADEKCQEEIDRRDRLLSGVAGECVAFASGGPWGSQPDAARQGGR